MFSHPILYAIHQEQFVTDPLRGLQLERGRIRQFQMTAALGQCGGVRPPKIIGEIVRCSSFTRPARKSASFSSPPPSQSSLFTCHFSRNHRGARGKSISVSPHTYTSWTRFRNAASRFGSARRVVNTMMGENFVPKSFASGFT